MARTARRGAEEMPEPGLRDMDEAWPVAAVQDGPMAEKHDDDPYISVVQAHESEDEDGGEDNSYENPRSHGYTGDSVRMYLNEAGRTPLLAAEKEVELSKEIEAGLFAGAVVQLAKARAQGEKAVEKVKSDLVMQDLEGARIKDRTARVNHAKNFIAFVEAQADASPVGSQRFRDLQQVERIGILATDHMLRANVRLVISIAKRYTGHGVEFLDLIQMGNQGLIRAVQKFDYKKGFKFSTYATWWIRQQISRDMANEGTTIRLPVHRAEQHQTMRRIIRDLRLEGVEVTPERIAEGMGVSVEIVKRLQGDAQVSVSLDLDVDNGKSSRVHGGGSTLGEFLADPSDPDGRAAEREFEMNEIRTQLDAVLQTLPEREADIMRLRYGIGYSGPHTLEQIAQIYGLSRERIRQVERESMMKLKSPARKELLEGLIGDQ